MIINVSLASNFALGADKSTAELGDDSTVVPSTIIPVEKIMAATTIQQQLLTNRPQTSFLTDFVKNRAASSGATSDTLVTLPRGLWTVYWNLTAKFQAALAFGVGPAVELSCVFPTLANTQRFAAMFRSPSGSANPSINGVFRILTRDEVAIRLDIGATGVNDAIDAFVALQVEKNI